MQEKQNVHNSVMKYMLIIKISLFIRLNLCWSNLTITHRSDKSKQTLKPSHDLVLHSTPNLIFCHLMLLLWWSVVSLLSHGNYHWTWFSHPHLTLTPWLAVHDWITVGQCDKIVLQGWSEKEKLKNAFHQECIPGHITPPFVQQFSFMSLTTLT